MESIATDLEAVSVSDFESLEAYTINTLAVEESSFSGADEAGFGVCAFGASNGASFAGVAVVVVEIAFVADDFLACGLVFPDIPFFATRAHQPLTCSTSKRTLFTCIIPQEMAYHTFLAVVPCRALGTVILTLMTNLVIDIKILALITVALTGSCYLVEVIGAVDAKGSRASGATVTCSVTGFTCFGRDIRVGSIWTDSSTSSTQLTPIEPCLTSRTIKGLLWTTDITIGNSTRLASWFSDVIIPSWTRTHARSKSSVSSTS